MQIENITLVKLVADPGTVLTNGSSYGKTVYLSPLDSSNNWSEIPEEDMPGEDHVDEEVQ